MEDGTMCGDYRRRAILVALFLIFAGPFIGALAFLAMFFAMMSENDIKPDASIIVLVFFLAYRIAGLSAVLTSLALGRQTLIHGTFNYSAVIPTSIVATFLGTFLTSLTIPHTLHSFIGMAFFLSPFSIFATLICRWLMAKIGILPTSETTSLAPH